MEPRANSICNGKASASSGSDDFEDYDDNIMMIIIMMKAMMTMVMIAGASTASVKRVASLHNADRPASAISFK